MRTYSTGELVDLTDLTYRQADYWCTLGVLKPLTAANPGSGGTPRRFAESELVIAAVCAQLSELGATVHDVCEKVATQLRATWIAESFPERKLYVTPEGDVRPVPCAPGWCVDLDAVLVAA